MQPVITPLDAVRKVTWQGGSPLRNAQAESRFANRVRHHQQHLLGGARDGGNHHDAQRYAAGERGEMLLRQHHQRIDRDADDDRGNAIQNIGGEANDIDITPASELRHVNACTDAERYADERAMPRIIVEPTMAFAMPPPASPTGRGVLVRKAQFIEPTPLYTR